MLQEQLDLSDAGYDPMIELNSASRIAAQIRRGDRSAVTTIEAALARITELDGRLNAFTLVRAREALLEAEVQDRQPTGNRGPLAGVPVAVKEEYDVAGCVTTHGGFGNSTPAAANGPVVRKLRAAGAIIVGRTNMPEFGQFPVTESLRFGATRNPWDQTRSPGGSSGGSAVAVATGMAAVGMSSDGGGSIRIPASACGLIGLKPTRGRVSSAPPPQRWHGMTGFGPITRTVADAALVLDLISGNEPTDQWRLEPATGSFAAGLENQPGQLRILGASNPVTPGIRTDPLIQSAITDLLDRMVGLGYEVLTGSVRWPSPVTSFLTLYLSGIRTAAGCMEHPERLEPRTRAAVASARWISPRAVERALRTGRRITGALEKLFEQVDVVVLPTLTMLPWAFDEFEGLSWVRSLWRSTPMVGQTAIFNVSGHLAMSVPAGISPQGLPIGAQLVAGLGREDLLLSLAAELERQQPWPVWDGLG